MQKVSSSKSVSGVPVRPTLANSSSLFLISSRLATYIRLSSFTVKWVRSWARSRPGNCRAGQIESQRFLFLTSPRSLASCDQSYSTILLSPKSLGSLFWTPGVSRCPQCSNFEASSTPSTHFLPTSSRRDNIAEDDLRIAKAYHCLLANHTRWVTGCCIGCAKQEINKPIIRPHSDSSKLVRRYAVFAR